MTSVHNEQEFYEDIFEELAKHGEIENLNVCDNLADHMVGSVYAKFRDEDAAARAMASLQGRFYAGRPIMIEFSPVTDFREATCRQYEENTCTRGGYCNFMHLRPISRLVCWRSGCVSVCKLSYEVLPQGHQPGVSPADKNFSLWPDHNVPGCARDLRKVLFGRYKRRSRSRSPKYEALLATVGVSSKEVADSPGDGELHPQVSDWNCTGRPC